MTHLVILVFIHQIAYLRFGQGSPSTYIPPSVQQPLVPNVLCWQDGAPKLWRVFSLLDFKGLKQRKKRMSV